MEATKYSGAAVLDIPRAMTRKGRVPVCPKHTPTQSKMAMCRECGETFKKRRHNQRFCSSQCKWTHTNRTRTLKPNVSYDCVVCGKRVEKYLEPSKQEASAMRYCSRACKGKDLSGERHHAWTGGRNVTSQGYIEVYAPDHPHATQRGYVLEHRLVMEQVVGRYLDPEEVVHHENDNTQDNDPGNLRLFANNAEHKAYEHAKRQRDEAGRYLPLEVST